MKTTGRRRKRHGRHGLRRADPEVLAAVSRSRSSATRRTSTTTASCSRRCSPAKKPPTTSSLNALEWYQRQRHRPARSASASSTSTPKRRRSPATTAASRRTTRCCWRRAARAWMPPIDGLDKDGVFAFRTLDDTRALLERARPGMQGGRHRRRPARSRSRARAAGAGLRRHGRAPDGHADGAAARPRRRRLPAGKMEELGMSVLLRRSTTAHARQRHGRRRGASRTATMLDADLVVVAAGIRPNVDLGRKAGLHVNRGIVVNDYMETSRPRHLRGRRVRRASRRLLRPGGAALSSRARCWRRRSPATRARPTPARVQAAKLKIMGVDVFSAGDWSEQNAGDRCATRIRRSASTRS